MSATSPGCMRQTGLAQRLQQMCARLDVMMHTHSLDFGSKKKSFQRSICAPR